MSHVHTDRWILLYLSWRHPELILTHSSGCVPSNIFGFPRLSPVPLESIPHLCNRSSASASNTFISLKRQVQRYRFHIALPGNAASGRFLHQIALAATSPIVLMLPQDHYLHIYTGALLPNVHFIPVEPSLSDLVHKLQWYRSRPEEAMKVAHNLALFSRRYGRLEDWLCYVAQALKAVESLTAHIPLLPEALPRKYVYHKSLQRTSKRNRRFLLANSTSALRFQLSGCHATGTSSEMEDEDVQHHKRNRLCDVE